jgi:hypothetical protein
MYPYYLNICNDVDLFRLSDGRFQLIEQGKLEPLMVGYNYVIAEKELADYFLSLDIEGISFEPTKIFDRSEGKDYSNYVKLVIGQHFDSYQIADIDLDGKRFLVMDKRYLFVSPELKSILAKSDFSFVFTEGLTDFG